MFAKFSDDISMRFFKRFTDKYYKRAINSKTKTLGLLGQIGNMPGND